MKLATNKDDDEKFQKALEEFALVPQPDVAEEAESEEDSQQKKTFTVDTCFTNNSSVVQKRLTVTASSLIVAAGRGAREAKKLLPKHTRFSELTITVYRDEQA